MVDVIPFKRKSCFIPMAGPCLSIFVPQKPSRTVELQIRAVIDSIANTVDGDDFWVANRPFFVRFGEPEEDERHLLLNGWRPEGVVSFCAMCNDQARPCTPGNALSPYSTVAWGINRPG